MSLITLVRRKLRTAKGKAVPLRARVRQHPLPLLDEANRTVVSWSAKSACTHVLIWHLQRIGLLEEAQSHHWWPHRYRAEVYYHSHNYRQARRRLEREGPGQWAYVKVMRDPAKRCVSSYRHALKHGYEDGKMTRTLGRRIDHREGFSYETFLDYLSRIDLRRCDIHHRLQKHSLDHANFSVVYLVNVDRQELDGALCDIDNAQGVTRGREDERAKQATERAARRHADEYHPRCRGGTLWREPLKKSDTSAWPKHALEASPEAARRVRELYQADYNVLDFLDQRSALK